MTKNYSELASQAQLAVASINDPELRRVAFEKILDHLLNSETSVKIKDDRNTDKKKPTSNKRQPKKTSGPKKYIEELLDDAFFKSPKTLSEVKEELSLRGHHIALTSLSGPLQLLCQNKKLRRQKTKEDANNKSTFSYSNW